MAGYSSVILADSPQAYYRLDEASGTVATDSSGHGYNGTIAASGVTYSQPGAITTETDTAMKFDGTANIALPISLTPNGWGAATLECWVKLPVNTFGNYPRLISNQGNPQTDLVGIDIELAPASDGNSGYTRIGIGGTSGFQLAFGKGVLIANTWYHLVTTYSGTLFSVYINGSVAASTPVSGTIGANARAFFLADDGSADRLAGILDEVAIYNYALTAAQVNKHYLAGVSGPGNTTYAYGSTSLHDLKNYFLLEKHFDAPPVAQALYQIARLEGKKRSGEVIGQRTMTAVVRVVSQVSRPDLEAKLDTLYGGLFSQRQQPLTLHALDGRYWIADCVSAVAELAPIKSKGGGSYPGSGVLFTDVTITFVAVSPFALAAAPASYDTGSTTLVAQGGGVYSFTPFGFSGGGNMFARPTIRLYNQTVYPAQNNTTTTASITSGSVKTSISVAALPQAASIGDVFVLGWGNATFQTVTLSAGAAQNATTLTVNQFTANATYPSGSPCNKDFSWTNVTIQQINDAQTLSISAPPSSQISTVNGDFLDIFCDPTLPLGYSIVKNSNPATLLAFNGIFPVVEPVSTNWLISVTCNNITPIVEAVFTWTPRWVT